jgi:hypothetical protein
LRRFCAYFLTMPAFVWTAKREKAALLVAEDRISDEAIAEEVGITARTLDYWKQHTEFAARVADHVEAMRKAVLTKGIADRVNRVAALDLRWEKMKTVIAERAIDPRMEEVPGGTTGLLVHQIKGIGKGDDFQVVDEYRVDDGLLRELRAHEEQAARELGQWVERGEVSGPNGAAIPVAIEESIERIFGNAANHTREDDNAAPSSSGG